MNPSFFNKLLVSFLVFLSLLGIFFYFQSTAVNKSTKQCRLSGENSCSVELAEGQILVQFNQKIELEEELSLNISIPKTLKLTSSWVQGVNMYMGKTAVMIDPPTYKNLTNVHKGRIFLGACSEPSMKWQLVVQVENVNSELQSYFFNFSTER